MIQTIISLTQKPAQLYSQLICSQPIIYLKLLIHKLLFQCPIPQLDHMSWKIWSCPICNQKYIVMGKAQVKIREQ